MIKHKVLIFINYIFHLPDKTMKISFTLTIKIQVRLMKRNENENAFY